MSKKRSRQIRRRRHARAERSKGTYKRWEGDTPQKKGDPGIKPEIPPYQSPQRRARGWYEDPIQPMIGRGFYRSL